MPLIDHLLGSATVRPATWRWWGPLLTRRRHIDDVLFPHADAVVNLEASPGYPPLPRFLAEVERVLRRGGSLHYAGIRGSRIYAALERGDVSYRSAHLEKAR